MATHSSALARKGGAWWAAVYGVAQSQTRPKRLSSSSSRAESAGQGLPVKGHKEPCRDGEKGNSPSRV